MPRWSLVAVPLLLALPLSAAPSAATQKDGPRLDHYGDPLPEHALFRIGTTRFRTGGKIQALAFTTDALRLVTVDAAIGVHVWDVVTGKELLPFDRPKWSGVGTVSADGSRAAVITSENLCKIYDTATGKEIQSVPLSWLGARLLCFSPDKTLLACASGAQSREKYVNVWNLKTGAMVREWSPGFEKNGPDALAFSPNGKILAYSGSGTPVYLWEIRTGNWLDQIPAGKVHAGYRSLAFSPNGADLTGINNETHDIYRWKVATGEQLKRVAKAGGSAPAGFTPDGKSFITGLPGSEVQMWNLETGKLERTLSGIQNGIGKFAFSADGKLFAAVCDQHEVRLWDLKSGKGLHDFEGHTAPFVRAWFTSDNKTLVSSAGSWCEEAYTFKFWDAAMGKALRQVSWKGTTASVSGDGRTLSVQQEGKTRVRDIISGKQIQELDTTGSTNGSNAMPMTADGRLLVVQSAKLLNPNLASSVKLFQHSFQVWDVVAGKKLIAVEEKPGERFSCRFTDDGRCFAVHSGGSSPSEGWIGSMTFWDLRSGRKVIRAPLPLAARDIGTFSPSGRLMAWQDLSRQQTVIHVKELATGKLIRELRPDEKSKIAQDVLAFSPDGYTVASGTRGGEILLWNIFTEEPIACLPGHRGSVNSVSFSLDGKRLVSGGHDDTMILVWDVSRWTDRVTAPKAPLRLTAAEWEDMAGDDPAIAYSAVRRLLQAPKKAVAMLRQHLLAVQGPGAKEIADLLVQLDSNRFADREQAIAKLQKLGVSAMAALEKALDGNLTLEVRQRVEQLLSRLDNRSFPPQMLQQLRALDLLEMLATPDAVELLQSLARGESDTWLVLEAAAALDRVRRRTGG